TSASTSRSCQGNTAGSSMLSRRSRWSSGASAATTVSGWPRARASWAAAVAAVKMNPRYPGTAPGRAAWAWAAAGAPRPPPRGAGGRVPRARRGADQAGDGMVERPIPGLVSVGGDRDGKVAMDDGVIPAAQPVLGLAEHRRNKQPKHHRLVVRGGEHAGEILT